MKLKTGLTLAIIPVAALALAFIAGLLLLHSAFGRACILKQAQQYLASELETDLQAAAFDFNLLTGTVGMKEVSLTSRRASLPSFLTVEELSLEFGVAAAVRGRLLLREGTLTGLAVRLVTGEDGGSNLPDFSALAGAQPESEAGVDAFLISNLEISGSSFLYEDRRNKLRLELPGWRFAVAGRDRGASHRVLLESLQQGALQFDDDTIGIRRLHFDATLSNRTLQVARLELGADGAQLLASGFIPDLAAPVLDFEYTGGLDLEHLGRFFGLAGDLQGKAMLRGTVMGPPAQPQVGATLAGESLDIFGYRQVDLAAGVSWRTDSLRLTVTALSARSPAGSVAGTGSFDFKGEDPLFRLQLEPAGLDLHPLTRRLGLPVAIASRASGRLSASWSGTDFAGLEGSSNLALRAESARGTPKDLPVGADLRLLSGRSGHLLSISGAEILGTSVAGQIRLAPDLTLGGMLRAEAHDLPAALQRAAALFGTAADGFPETGSAVLEAGLGGTIDSPSAAIVLQAEDLRYGNADGISFRAQGDLDLSRLRVHEGHVEWAGHGMLFRGEVGLTGPDPMLALEASAEGVPASSLAKALGLDAPIEGVLGAKIKLSGTMQKPAGTLELTAEDLLAYSEPLGRLSAEAALDGDRLEVLGVELRKPSGGKPAGRLEASGTWLIGDGRYTLRAEGRDLLFGHMQLPGDVTVAGSLGFVLNGSGSLDQPYLETRMAWDNLRVQERDLGNISLEAKLGGGDVNLSALAPGLKLSAQARVELAVPHAAEIEITAEDSDLSALQLTPEAGGQLSGSLTGTLKASGNLEQWTSGRASMRIRDLVLKHEGLELRNQAPLAVDYLDGTLAVQPATLAVGEARLHLAGSFPLLASAPPSSLVIRGETELGTLARMIPSAALPDVGGRLRLDARIEGNGGRINPMAEIHLSDGFVDPPQLGSPLAKLNAHFRVAGGAVVLEGAQGEWAGGRFRASGELPLGLFSNLEALRVERREGPAVFSAELSGVQLGSLPAMPEQLKGEVSIRVEGEARSPDASGVRGTVTFDELRLQAGTYELRQEERSLITFDAGVARLERYTLLGPKTRIEAAGTAGFTGEMPLNLRATGTADAGVLAFMLEDVRAAGDSRFELSVKGTAAAPEITGFVETAKAQLSLSTPRLQADNLDLRLNLFGTGAVLERLTGSLNGGTITAGGEIEYSAAGLGRVDLTASASNVYLNYPSGLRSSLDGSIGLRSRDEFLEIWGALHFLEGLYTDRLDLEGELIRFLRSGRPQAFEEEQSPLLSKIRYNVLIDTDSPLLVDNNLARLAMNANLRLSGTWYRPVIIGRLGLEEGGELYLREREYFIDRGVVDFANQSKIEPSLDILARTKAEGQDIELKIAGTIDNLQTSLKSLSNPELSEPDIISLLLTGRTLDDFRGAELNVATEQAMSYFAGRVSGSLARGAEQALGLSRVRIEPSLIAAESDPGAKLTIGQDITRDLQLVYSMDLVNSQNQIWIADYRLTPRFETRAVKQEDNTYRFEIRHDVRFGRPLSAGKQAAARDQTSRRVGSFTFGGERILGDEEIIRKVGVKPGDKYDFFKLQDGIAKLESLYRGRGYLETRLRTERAPADGTIDLTLNIEPGPEVGFAFEGEYIPAGVREIAAASWREAVFDAQRGENAVLRIRRHLVRDKHFGARVSYRLAESSSARKMVVFRIDSGPKYSAVNLEFSGASGVPPALLKDSLTRAGLLEDVFVLPEAVSEFLVGFYRDHGYLDAAIDRPEPDLDPAQGTGRVVISVREGPLYRIEAVRLQGNSAHLERDLRALLGPVVGQPYRPEALNRSIGQLQDFYWRRGFSDVSVDYRLLKNAASGSLALHFEISENLQEVVEDIVIDGQERSGAEFARSKLEIAVGDILNYDRVNRSRKNLYDTGAYSLVDLEVRKLPLGSPPAGSGPQRQPVQLNVKLREVSPYVLRYGGSYDTERGPGAVVEAARRNFLGSARALGMRARYDSEFQEIRGYFSQPTLLKFPLKTNLTVFSQRTVFPTFFDDAIGFSLQQEARLGNKFIISYGYRYQRAHTFDKEPDPIFPFDITIPVARFSAAVTRENRDDLLDASRGSFTSHALEYSPTFLGSDIKFIRYFGQYFKYFPLSRPSEIPMSGGIRKPRLVYAVGLRAGLARTFDDQILLRGERFFAGGGTTLRGFDQQGVGPTDFFGDPTGGSAVFIANQEIRFPAFGIIDGVGFLDLGNVYSKASDFNPFDVRKSAGLGLRVRTPFLLLRLDYGFKLDRRPGESRGTFFFSIGQAF